MKCTGNRITVVAEGGKEAAETKEKKNSGEELLRVGVKEGF